MKDFRSIRVMWLLNHTSARKFEIPMMKSLGFREFFLPKIVPAAPAFRSASIDRSEDADLTIPSAELEVLNRTDWYGAPGEEAWAIANRYFDLLFFILTEADPLAGIVRNFKGAVIWRAFGLAQAATHEAVLSATTRNRGEQQLNTLGRRFWFGAAYKRVAEHETGFLGRHAIHLPLGMHDCAPRSTWTGDIKKIFFVCPDIGINPYYRSIFDNFKQDFSDFPHVIAGDQPIAVNDATVLGYLPAGEHEQNMRRYRVMFYHSTEPAHVHYHPFEAIRAGMPVIFMAGSLLDALGDGDLPGRCKTIAEAKKKLQRILDGDQAFTTKIRSSQLRLLEPMKAENSRSLWQAGLSQVLATLERTRQVVRPKVARRRRIAVILPEPYGGGTLNSTKQLAHALQIGSERAGEPAEIVFGHVRDPSLYPDWRFADLPSRVKRRPFHWKRLSPETSEIATAFAAPGAASGASADSLLPDDGINGFLDCDLWIIISDRLTTSILPIRPYLMVVHDYIQRYVPIIEPDLNVFFLRAAHEAERVLVTSEFTFADARQYAGIPEKRLRRLPLILPRLEESVPDRARDRAAEYFLWPTNRALHKNHANAAEALRRYFDELDGKLDCRISGVGTHKILGSEIPHLQPLLTHRAASRTMKRKLHFMGELREPAYATALSGARFVWHPTLIDNGSFTVIEAAMRQVPALSSDYPAMREIDRDFQLNLSWMDPHDPTDMARQLKNMEQEAEGRRGLLPDHSMLARHSVENLAEAYWEAVRECL